MARQGKSEASDSDGQNFQMDHVKDEFPDFMETLSDLC